MQKKNPGALIDRKEFYRNLARLALPIALQSLMLAAVAAGDALMLGKVAQDEMTAVSLATQIQFVQNMFLSAVTGAGAILGAQYWGKGDRAAKSSVISSVSVVVNIILNAIFIFGWLGLPEMDACHVFLLYVRKVCERNNHWRNLLRRRGFPVQYSL